MKFWLLALLLPCHAALAQLPDSGMHIYILMGQSNMAGRGQVTEAYRSMGHEHLLMLTQDLQWVPARHPLHFDKPQVAGVGPGLSFGLSMLEGSDGTTIGLVPCAVGGTAIRKWAPGVPDSVTGTFPYNDAVMRIMEAMKHGEIKGVLWHQGEADSNPEAAKLYVARLATLIERIRCVVGNPELPFVIGELGPYKAQFGNINAVLPEVQQRVPHTVVVSSADLVHNGDGTHLDSESATLFGQRYAEGMRQLQKK